MCAANVTREAMQGARIELPTVTLVAATSVAIRETVAAMNWSSRGLAFAKAILFTHQDPGIDPGDGIEWRRIERLGSRADYSRFMLRELVSYIQTDHVLCVQSDHSDSLGTERASYEFPENDTPIGGRAAELADCCRSTRLSHIGERHYRCRYDHSASPNECPSCASRHLSFRKCRRR